jgi:glycosyltransferase involved in cell wall biosynthesis
MLKVTYVVPRYGLEVIGGAEYGARMLAEHLVGEGVAVEVCTTCALDSQTWADEYPTGTVDINGVTVRRFRSVRGRDARFEQFSAGVLADPSGVAPEVERRWFELQGPVCPAALDAAEVSGADVVVFYPYLFWPTVEGVPRFGRRAVLHPAAHDEPPIRLPVFRRVFSSVGGVVFHTIDERRLTERLFPTVSTLPQATVGLGVTPADGSEAAARADLGIGDRPFLLCLGRVDNGKGTLTLHQFFAAYKERHPGPLALVFAGPVVDPLPAHHDIVVAGPVDEAVKWGALRGADVLVSPSPLESLSLVLLEGWRAGRPALVNGRCDTTRRQVAISHGGLWFDSYLAFEVALERLVADRQLRGAMGEAGRAYVERRYAWPRLISRYRCFLESIARQRDPQVRS